MTDPQRSRVRVIYKSGAIVDLTCKDFTARTRGGTLVEVEWDDPEPRPMYFGVDNVAAIWELPIEDGE